MSARMGGRPGYALLIVVVGLVAIAVVVAMAVTPNIAQARDQWRVEHALERLTHLTDGGTAIVRFHADIGTYPGALSHLSTQITTADNSLCGTPYTTADVDEWGGRYAGRIYLPAGTPLSIGMMADTLEHDVLESALVLRVTGVREEQARRLDRKVDGGGGAVDAVAGRVRYTTADAEGLVTLRWRKPITAC